MKLVSYNIQYGFVGDGRHDPTRCAKIVVGSTPYHRGAAYLGGFVGGMFASRVRAVGGG